MMTFEEFFAKKKIDLPLLQGDNRSLYDEFRQHYAQMGEKSFDHTKKFWFNKLRKQYALIEEEETAVKDQAVSAEILEEMSPHPTETVVSSKPSGFKPRFKAGATKAAEPEKPKEEEAKPVESASPASKPSGFKPRFKAAEPEKPKEEEETKPVESASPASKPSGFKPRFKAGVTRRSSDPEKPKD
ncbi:hypothetical protein FXV77_00190 [Sphingobacterium phlebotomi]|uniref:Uncharacterized protein n=1 Tax=Sphingobacterium phlebotomi TaxID=2605433 RepID=A0A5D4H9B2_9SPHI|nr:hypothetical protein [Sphingobacterium phlebotomi]TYR37751.1 hypothetical protein FXV77_00190 [Sphingobacterium phlebotomi]